MSEDKTKSRSMRNAVRLLPLVVGVAVLLFFWGGRGNAENAPEVAPRATETQNAFTKVLETVQYGDEMPDMEYRFQAPPGRVIEYGFNIRHEVRMVLPKNPMDASHGDLEPQVMNLGIKGTLVSAAYASERAGSLLLGFEVTGIEMESDQEMNRGQRDLLSESMRHEVFARITPRGRFEQLWFPPEMVSQARDLAREIILRTQVILPETPVASWKTMEEDVTGLFEAGYEGRGGKLGGKDILEISRRKISYVTINSVGTGGSKDIPTDPSGKTTAIVMLEEGWLRDLHSSEGLKAGGESYMARITKKTEAGLLFRKIWNDPDRAKRSALQLARRLSTMHASSPIGLENAEENAEMRRGERLESVAGGKSFQQVLNEMLLPLYQSGSLQGSDASRIRRILAAIFELDPAQVADALSRMKSGTVPVDVMAMIATAFGQAGTPSAQTALVELINDEQMDPKVRMPALLAMVSPRSPTVEAQKALQALVDPNDPRGLGANTLLVLGAMTKNLNRFGGEGADDMVAFLLDQESSFREAGNTEVFLSAIGNAGDDRGFDAVTGYLGDPSEDVRASAVDALSGMTHKGVSALLVQALGDGKERVQVRAIRGLKLQAYTSTTSASVGAVLSSSPSVYVRKAALRYFQKHAAENPGAMEAIRLAASNDVDENVRKMAQDLIR